MLLERASVARTAQGCASANKASKHALKGLDAQWSPRLVREAQRAERISPDFAGGR
jgi:hypothetical protein